MALDLPQPHASPAPPEGSVSAPFKPLKIAILSYRCAPHVGGQGVYVEYLSTALSQLGHSVDVISGPPYCDTHESVTDIHLPSLDLYAQPHNGHYALQPKHLLSPTDTYEYVSHLTGKFSEPITFGQRAYRYLKKHGHQYDIILDNQCLASGTLKLQTDLKLPLVTMIHHPITEDLRLALEAEDDFWMRQLIRRWYSFHHMQVKVSRQLKHIISPSMSARNHIAEEFNLPAERITPIRLGVDKTYFHPNPDMPRKARQIVTTVSADSPLKGLKFLIEAVHQLTPDFPDLELVIVGKSLSEESEKLLSDYNLTDRTKFRSELSREEIADAFRTATLLVSPSLYEGFGLPPAEAMMCGTPVIVTDGGALPEVAGDAGLVVPKGNPDALAAAIADLLTDTGKRQSVAEACLERAQSVFDWSQIAREYDAYFRQVLATSC